MTNSNIKSKTKRTTILASVLIGLLVISSSAIVPNVNAAAIRYPPHPPPKLSPSENQTIIDTAIAVPGLQAWSHDWRYVLMGFGSNNNKLGTPEFQWQFASVVLKAPSNSAPIACSNDWRATVVIDMTTMKVVSASYPTIESHPCQLSTGLIGTHHTWSVATQNDVNSTSNPPDKYYGDYADLAAPDFLTSVYTDLNGAYVEQLVNADFPKGTGCNPINDTTCIEQGGWILSDCSCPNTPANTNDIIYVDESKTRDASNNLTTLKWINGVTTDIQAEIDCIQNTSAYYIIYVQNGTATFTENTNIPCTTPQNASDVTDNSVFFESADNDTTQNWPSDITGSVVAQSATEEKNSYLATPTAWSTSHNVDIPCTGYTHLYASKVITTGNLQNSGSATWSNLSKQPHAC